jgi:hypothetical protein
MVNSEEFSGSTECLTLYTRCRLTDVVITVFDCILSFKLFFLVTDSQQLDYFGHPKNLNK